MPSSSTIRYPHIQPEILELVPKMTAIRRDLHQYPELGLEEHHTSDVIVRHLEELGYSVSSGIAGTGVVGTLKQGTSSRSMGIRADMDALPITEETHAGHASRIPGKMHACGHDGHMAMVLGAAQAIAKRERIDGTLHLIFQPAEENEGGAAQMVRAGLFDRFPCDAVFGLHNIPDIPLGRIGVKDGPIMAAVDVINIIVHGRGGHGAMPESAADPVVAGASIVMALQTIVSRNIPPFEPAVVTVGSFHAGSASNIIPHEARMVVGIRSFNPEIRNTLIEHIRDIATGQAQSYGMQASVEVQPSYDATINPPAETAFVRKQARLFAGPDNVMDLERPLMGSEDFTYMLQACPGCFFFIGTGESDTKPLHHPAFDFNDKILPVGAGLWTHLAEAFLSPGSRSVAR